MRVLARLPFFPELMRKRVEKDIGASLKRSVSHPDILAQTMADTEALALFKALSTGVMTQMAARLPGTANDIRVTQTLDYPLSRIRVPTLVVHGTDDPHLKFEDHGLRLAKEIPDARLVRLEKGEHAAIFTHRRQVKTAVDEFLFPCR